MSEWLAGLWDEFYSAIYLNFIKDDRFMYIVDGLGVTLSITVLALIFGTIIGTVIAIIKVTHTNTGRWKIASKICTFYLTVIRGTPVVLQLMIIYFVVLSSPNIPAIISATLAFAINSGAYAAEIIRSGIMAVDKGQRESSKALGLSYMQSMWYIILPQAIKNILPALGNELITLLKETSVVGYIALQDITRGANIIKGLTYDAFMPLLAAALIYLLLVIGLTKLFGTLERRMRKSDAK